MKYTPIMTALSVTANRLGPPEHKASIPGSIDGTFSLNV